MEGKYILNRLSGRLPAKGLRYFTGAKLAFTKPPFILRGSVKKMAGEGVLNSTFSKKNVSPKIPIYKAKASTDKNRFVPSVDMGKNSLQ